MSKLFFVFMSNWVLFVNQESVMICKAEWDRVRQNNKAVCAAEYADDDWFGDEC